MAEPSQSFLIFVPREFDLAQRTRVGEDVVRFVQSRTKKGLDRFNRPFKPYSTSYKSSLDFKNAGKTPIVNLRLTGEMINLLMVLSTGIGFVKIGFDDKDENDKASWNRINGRQFMGLKQADLDKIIGRHINPSFNEQVIQDISTAVGQAFVTNLFGGSDGEDNN